MRDDVSPDPTPIDPSQAIFLDDQGAAPREIEVVDTLKEQNWIANLPQLLRYSQDGDSIQVPNASVLALAERLAITQTPDRKIFFVHQ